MKTTLKKLIPLALVLLAGVSAFGQRYIPSPFNTNTPTGVSNVVISISDQRAARLLTQTNNFTGSNTIAAAYVGAVGATTVAADNWYPGVTNANVLGTDAAGKLQAGTVDTNNITLDFYNLLWAGGGNVFWLTNAAGAASIYAPYSLLVSNLTVAGNATYVAAYVDSLWATTAVYSNAFITNGLYTVLTNAPMLATDGNGQIISTNTLSASQLTSGTNNSASIGAAEFSAGRFAATNTSQSSTFAGTVGIGATNLLAPLHVGIRNANNSVDSQVLVSRLVDSSVAGNGHAFSDSSLITRTGIGYNSYDARIEIGGASYDHYAAFQAAPTINISGSIGIVDALSSAPIIDGGTVNTLAGLYVLDATGGGGVDTNIGVWVKSLTKGTNNWALFTEGTTPSKLGGALGLGVAPTTQKLYVKSGSAGAYAPNANYDDVVVENSGHTGISLFSPDASFSGLQFSSPSYDQAAILYWRTIDNLLTLASTVSGSAIRFATDTASEKMRITSAGNVGIGTNNPAYGFTLATHGAGSGISWAIQNNHTNIVTIDRAGNLTYYGALVDGSIAPADLAEAKRIVASIEAKDGKVDHSKLDPAVWGTKTVSIPTGTFRTNTVAAVLDAGGKVLTEARTEVVAVTREEVQPDQSKRNVSMLISAQAMVAADSQKRITTLEAQVADLLKRVEQLEKAR